MTIDDISNLASAFDCAERNAEAARYYKAIVDALNATHDGHHQQDALSVFEGIARVVAQFTDGSADDIAAGYITYVAMRAKMLRGVFSAHGVEAKHFPEPQGRA